MKKGSSEKGMIVPTTCGGHSHEVFIHNSGAVIFRDHKSGLKALTMEYRLLSDDMRKKMGCAALAASMRGPVDGADLPVWFIRHLEAGPWRRHQQRTLWHKQGKDWLTGTCTCRVSVPVMAKAMELLKTMNFRTSATTGHRVDIVPLDAKSDTKVVGSSENTDTFKTRKRTFNKKRQVVTLHLNLKRWARVYLRGIAMVAGKFVTEIYWEKSRNEMVVDMLHQSVGNTITIQRCNIRRAHDGIWRIHDIL